MSNATRVCAVCEKDVQPRAFRRGMCGACYQRWQRHGHVTSPPLHGLDLFWSKVAKTETCWLWTGTITQAGGYGQFGNKQADVFGEQVAHRIAYIDKRGPIPDGLVLDHLCRVRHCVNPEHLEPVTQQTNVLRGVGVAAINAAKVSCPRGHEYDIAETGRRRACVECRRAAWRERWHRRQTA